MTTPEQRAANAEKARKYRASEAGKAYRQTEKYKAYRRELKRKARQDPQKKLKEQRCNFKCGIQRYGLTLEDWDQMLIAQSGRCAVCNDQFHNDPKEPAVDHNHQTGKVRGLLCNNCNLGLGHFTESAARLQSAIAYLHAHS